MVIRIGLRGTAAAQYRDVWGSEYSVFTQISISDKLKKTVWGHTSCSVGDIVLPKPFYI